MSFTHFETANHVRALSLTKLAEITQYCDNWGADFCVKEVKELVADIKSAEWFSKIDPTVFTQAELENLGFKRWSEETQGMLIPLYLLPFLVESFEAGCLDEPVQTVNVSEIDNDHRFGCLAYWVKPVCV